MLGVFDSCSFSIESFFEKQIVILSKKPGWAADLREKLIFMMASSRKNGKALILKVSKIE